MINEAKIKHSWSKNRTWLVRRNYISERARFHHYPSWYFNQVGEIIHIRKIHIQDRFQLTLLQFPSMLHNFFMSLGCVLGMGKIVKSSISKRQHVPFMTSELFDSIRHSNKLRKLYFNSKNPWDWEKYRLQRNLNSSLRRREISSYLRSRADSANGDPKQF